MQLDVGSMVDRYRLVERIGEGGMAVVFRVEHATLGTPHALKVLTMGGKQVKDRLVQEGRVQATLQHPHIVSVTDVLDIDGAPGLLMEYVDGPSLDDWLNKYRPTIDESLRLFRGIVAGVGLAHARGLIHRDLKPGNVMLHVTEEGVVPKVTDFGLAKVTEGNQAGGLKRTRTGMTMGTPAYMAPEQIRDSSAVDRRADLYSLGCILYELIAGQTPFEGDDMLALFAAIALGNYPPIKERVPDVPDNVAAVIEALLVDDCADRLPDCAAILDLLDDRPNNQTAVFPMAEGLGPPAPIGEVGPSVLPLDSPAADVARAMTRGVQMPSEISQVGWTSTAHTASAAVRGAAKEAPATEEPSTTSDGPATDPPVDSAPEAFDPETSVVIPVGKRAAGVAVLGAGLLVFLLAVGLAVAIGLFFLLPGADPGPTVRVTVEPEPVVPAPAPVVPSPEPVVVPTPEPVVPSPEPVVPSAEPVAPAPEPVVPTPSPVAPKPVAPAPVVPAPEPVAPVPEPVAPTPEPIAPEPVDPPATGQFTASGAGSVVLYTANASYAPGQPVPPGRYKVKVDGFDGGSQVTIRAGRTVDLKCVPVMGTCVPR
jgi:serine/threonine-protein kinase